MNLIPTIHQLFIFIIVTSSICYCDVIDEDEDEEGGDEGEDMEPGHGHMQPIGTSGHTYKVDEITSYPDPITFYDNYVLKSRPVIFRGMAKSFPSFQNLQSDDYLKKNYGKWKMFYEKGKKENRKGKGTRASFKEFLDLYKTKDIYMVSDIAHPNPLTNEVFVPKPLLCDDITKRFETCIMWFSSGGTKSVLHSDSLENINCLISGKKTFIMVHKNQNKLIPMTNDASHSLVDVEKVDFIKYPIMSRLTWYKAEVNAGDCLYIPYEWSHHVDSKGPRNVAINLWWNHMLVLPNRDQCAKQIKDDMKPYQSWTKFGRQAMMGKLTRFLIDFVNEKEPITSDRFHDHLFANYDKTEGLDQTDKLFKSLDKDGDGLIWYRDLYNSDIKLWKDFIGTKPTDDDNNVYKYEEVHQKEEL